MMIGIYAVLAQKERGMISERTKAALAAAKKRGKKLGGYREGALEKANAKRTKAADKQAERFAKIIVPLKEQGMSLKAIADRLNEMGIATVRGGTWEAKAVSRVLDRLGEREEDAVCVAVGTDHRSRGGHLIGSVRVSRVVYPLARIAILKKATTPSSASVKWADPIFGLGSPQARCRTRRTLIIRPAAKRA